MICMMDKDKVRKVLDNKGTSEEVREVIEWMRSGEDCISEMMEEDFESLRQGNAGEWAETDIPMEEMRRNLLNGIRAAKPKFWKKVLVAAAIAIPILLPLCGLWFVSDRTGLFSTVQYTEVEVPSGDKMKVILPDGSDVTLNALSRLRYPSRFGFFSREVELEGEAYFSVVANKSKPFAVHTGSLDVKVLGTKFNLKAYPDENVRIHLDEGSVLIEDHQSLNRSLKPGENAEYDIRTGNCQISNTIDKDVASAWTQNRQCFNKATLEEVVKVLTRLYGDRFNVGSQDILRERFTISFSNRAEVEDVLKDIETVSRVRFHKVQEGEWEIFRE